jgi:hypothetical protein
MKFPCYINEEVSFHTYPNNNLLEMDIVKSLLINNED